jgi:predicted transcriptional regulator
MSKQVNIRLDEATVATLDAVAQSQGHSRSALVQRAVKELVNREQRHIEAIDKAMADIDAGLGTSVEEFFDELEVWINSNYVKAPA